MIHLDFTQTEFTEIVKQAVSEAMAAMPATNPDPSPERRTLHSIRELADFIGCSTVTAHKFKKSGRIPCRQIGRKVLFDTAEVLNAMDQSKKKSRK